MNYEFPIIKTIDDVLPAIEGRDEFVVAERDGFTVINYNVGFDDTFTIDESDLMKNHGKMIPKGVMRRECRGLKFYSDGTISARPFDKWFNINEREETMAHRLDFSTVRNVMTKLDGSMIHPMKIGKDIRWMSKMGITDVALQAEEFIKDNSKYQDFASWCIDNSLTPIFEWCSRKQRIVIDYPKDSLTLLAVRHNITGKYEKTTT